MHRSHSVTAENFNSYIWENLAKEIPHCLLYKNAASQQFFEVAIVLDYYATLEISDYVHDWSKLLLEHEHEEVGRSTLHRVLLTNKE